MAIQCPKCGYPNVAEAIYCAQCGSFITQNLQTPQQYQQPYQPSYPQRYQYPPPVQSQKKSSNAGRLALGVSIAAIVIGVMLILVYVVIPVLSTPAEYERSYSWSYDGYTWTWDLTIPGSDYSYYKGSSHTYQETYGMSGYTYYVTETDDYIESLAEEITSKASSKGYDKYETASFLLAFIQSLPYTSDAVTTGHDEYPRYPVETLVDNGGDCEDTSILFAAIMEAYPINCDAVLLLLHGDPPTHCAAGIWGDSSLVGDYYNHNGHRYYYCETTGDGFKIGEKPTEFIGDSGAYVIDVD